jgi:hypothetical protein
MRRANFLQCLTPQCRTLGAPGLYIGLSAGQTCWREIHHEPCAHFLVLPRAGSFCMQARRFVLASLWTANDRYLATLIEHSTVLWPKASSRQSLSRSKVPAAAPSSGPDSHWSATTRFQSCPRSQPVPAPGWAWLGFCHLKPICYDAQVGFWPPECSRFLHLTIGRDATRHFANTRINPPKVITPGGWSMLRRVQLP